MLSHTAMATFLSLRPAPDEDPIDGTVLLPITLLR